MAEKGKAIIFDQKIVCKLLKWKVHPGSRLSTGTILFHYELSNNENTDEKTHKYKCIVEGTVQSLAANEGDLIQNGSELLFLHPCMHSIVLKELCAECGADLRQLDSVKLAQVCAATSVSMIHSVPELRISEEEARQLGKADEDRLLKTRKLALLVDLDQTLIHTTNEDVPPDMKGVYHFQLYGARSPWYHTKMRPGTEEFLKKISKLYELHIFTFGARPYAHHIACLMDSEGKYFSHRILSRDECFSQSTKVGNLKALFPCGDSMVCIIDDREDVWNFAPNLIPVKPYHFFSGTGDINAPPGSDNSSNNLRSKNEKRMNTKLKADKKEAEEAKKDQASILVKLHEEECLASEMDCSENVNYNEAESLCSKIVKDNSELLDDNPNNEITESNNGETAGVLEGLNIKDTDKNVTDISEQSHQNTSTINSTDTETEIIEADSAVSDIPESMEIETQLTIEKGRVEVADGQIPTMEVSQTDDEKMENGSTNVETCLKKDAKLDELIGQTDDEKMENECHVKEDETIVQTNDEKIENETVVATNDGKMGNENPTEGGKALITEGEKALITDKDELVVPADEQMVQNNPGKKTETVDEQKADIIAEVEENSADQTENSMKDEINGGIDESLSTVKRKDDETKTVEPSNDFRPSYPTEDDDDDFLLYLEEILTTIHQAFYHMYDQLQAKGDNNIPDLKTVIPYVRRKVLRNTNIIFSGVIPNNIPPEKTKLYIMAKSLGANIQQDLVPWNSDGTGTTHLVAAKLGTAKVNKAKKMKGVHITSPDWLWCCWERWEHVDERLFPLLETTMLKNPYKRHKGADKNSSKLGSGSDKGQSAPTINAEPCPVYDPFTGKRIRVATPGINAGMATNFNPEHRGFASGTRSARSKLDRDTSNPETSKESPETFSSSYSPLLSFSSDDLTKMGQEVDDACSEESGNSEDTDNSNGGSKHIQEDESSQESLTGGECPKGWRKRKKSEQNEQDEEHESDFGGIIESEDDDCVSKFPRREIPYDSEKSENSDSDEFNQSIGSVDEEMAAAVEREFLN